MSVTVKLEIDFELIKNYSITKFLSVYMGNVCFLYYNACSEFNWFLCKCGKASHRRSKKTCNKWFTAFNYLKYFLFFVFTVLLLYKIKVKIIISFAVFLNENKFICFLCNLSDEKCCGFIESNFFVEFYSLFRIHFLDALKNQSQKLLRWM